jgi:uncharacterized SAM-binding protein YcdF (DUF218 family)
MLDPALCDRPTSQWLSLKDILSTWLTTSWLVVLTFLVLIGLPWVIPKLRWKPQLSGLGAGLLLIYCVGALPPAIAVASQGLVALLPADSGATAGAIVVLGRGEDLRNPRVEVAAELWQARRAPLIFTSGHEDGPLITQLLEAKGIPSQVLDNEDCSRTTEENARFTAAVLQPQGIRQILLVTDPPHMLRSLLTFRSLGFTVIPHTSPLPPDLPHQEEALKVFSEYMGLVSYGLRGRFFPRQSAEAMVSLTQPKQLEKLSLELNRPQAGILRQALQKG